MKTVRVYPVSLHVLRDLCTTGKIEIDVDKEDAMYLGFFCADSETMLLLNPKWVKQLDQSLTFQRFIWMDSDFLEAVMESDQVHGLEYNSFIQDFYALREIEGKYRDFSLSRNVLQASGQLSVSTKNSDWFEGDHDPGFVPPPRAEAQPAHQESAYDALIAAKMLELQAILAMRFNVHPEQVSDLQVVLFTSDDRETEHAVVLSDLEVGS